MIKNNVIIFISLMFFSCLAVALNTANMIFSGTLITPPPCKINGGIDMTISFDKVGISKVDGENYRREIPYNLDCVNISPWSLSMMLTTSSIASFAPSTIQTNVPGFGIKIYIDGKEMTFSKAFFITGTNHPVLEAVPVSQKGINLPEGKFSASATLTVQYQ